MLINVEINDTSQKMIWAQALHTCKCGRNSMATMGGTKIPFETFYGEKPNIIGSFSWFGRIAYITKWDKLNRQMTYKTYQSIMVGYAENNTRDTYKL